jgi:hypothetical protein
MAISKRDLVWLLEEHPIMGLIQTAGSSGIFSTPASIFYDMFFHNLCILQSCAELGQDFADRAIRTHYRLSPQFSRFTNGIFEKALDNCIGIIAFLELLN